MTSIDPRAEIREFLRTRRARISPEEAGLPAYGGNRRVPGLRREEVAMLAGVSVDYYVRMERGGLGGASESVLDALARALSSRTLSGTTCSPSLGPPGTAGPEAALTPAPRAPRRPAGPRRHHRRASLDPQRPARHPRDEPPGPCALRRRCSRTHAARRTPPVSSTSSRSGPRELFVDYDQIARDAAAMLRLEAGRNPHDKRLIELVGELSTRSELFRQRWASQDVRYHRSGRKRLRHPVVGQLDLDFEAMELPSEPGLQLNVYTAAAGTPTSDALKLLASWVVTQDTAGSENSRDSATR